jgi:opacity protein-like surface antigen
MDSKSRKQTSILRGRYLLMFSLALLALGLSDRARAQAIQWPRVDIFAAYSYLRSTTAISGEPINLDGGSFSAAFYLNRWLGVAGDVGVYHAGNIANQFSLTLWSYQAGPRVRLHNDTRFTPYGQFLIGGGHAGGTLYTSSLGFGLAPIGANNSFLFTVGGGLDCRLNGRIGIRIVQAEYLRSEFLNGSSVGHQQNNFRLSTGIVFKFGKND